MARASATAGTRASSSTTGGRGREVVGIILLGLALFVGLSVVSLQIGHGTLMGPCGATVGLAVYALVGVGSYLVAFGLGLVAVRCLTGRPLGIASVASVASAVGTLSLAVLLHLALGRFRLRGYGPGGLVGEYGTELLASLVGRVGAALFGVMGLAIATVLATPISMKQVVPIVARALRAAGAWLWRAVTAVFPSREEREAARAEARSRVADETRRLEAAARALPARPDDDTVLTEQPAKRGRRKKADEAPVAVVAGAVAPVDEPAPPAPEAVPSEVIDDPTEAQSGAPEDEEGDAPSEKPAADKPQPRIVEPVVVKPKKAPEPQAAAKAEKVDYIPAAGGYHLPDIDLLDAHPETNADIDRQGREEMLALAEKLQRTLADYGVRGQVQEIHPGPVVTMYEFVPAAGTKLSKITSLSNDLAMALAALRVRIVAPIPGKSSVGIEVPNKKRTMVYLRDVLGDQEVQKSKSRLTMALGKDISGSPVAVDLAKMPHLLVAGTTGSGKSVGVNGMICSILMHATPDEVRMIMIDPKMVELSVYEGIPHLLLPVVTDPKKANLALHWAVEEMERRYELVSKAGVRDIVSYNKRVEKLLAEPPPAPQPAKIKVYVTQADGSKEEVEVEASEEAVARAGGVVDAEVREEISAAHAAHAAAQAAAEPPPKKLPYIVVVIDEFADLMMVAPKDVETSVARIAQKARAVGIHLIVATQRPSVDVITGLIKANFPSRIGYQVASKIDSRTILDQQGAENLLGNGDMLFTDRGQALRRIHGAFVSDDEVKRLVEHLQKQGKPVYDMDILKPREEEGEEGGGTGLPDDEGVDPLYDQAVRIVCETRNASVSMIQRRLQIGFNRASRMVERMEREGIVGAANGSKPREVLAQAI
jgi:S-DNA-T family DNA segregation ATPase FtsK/SpoIIIE